MVFSYNWLQKYIEGDLPPVGELSKKLSLHSFEVEAFKEFRDDFLLEVEITPNRAGDCASHIGLARECAVICGLALKMPEVKPRRAGRGKELLKIKVEDQVSCPRYSACVLENVEVGESPEWLKENIISCGLQPINNVVDVANYVMLETGQPLHAFDLDKLEGGKIVVRPAQEGEEMVTLDNQRVKLDSGVLVIADSQKPVALAGIKGGRGPEVRGETKRIVLESANFEPVLIRNTSRKLKIKTDASWRFEHRLDPNMTEQALNRAAYLIQEVARAKPVVQTIDHYPQKITPAVIGLRPESIKTVLGVEVPKKEVTRILSVLGFGVEKGKNRQLKIKVPTWRKDVSIKEDLIEEVGRIYSYGKIISRFPKAQIVPPSRNFNIFWEENAKDSLQEAGFTEVYNYSFISREQADLFGFSQDELVEVTNFLSKKYQYLAPSLICNLAVNVRDNLKYFGSVYIFELSSVFISKKRGVEEQKSLAGMLTRTKASRARPKIYKSKEHELFFEAKGALEKLFSNMLVLDIWYDDARPTPEQSKPWTWDLSRSAEIKFRKEEIGFIGFLSEKIRKEMKIRQEVVGFQLDFSKLRSFASEEHEFEAISPYPVATRDLALLVPRRVKIAEVLNVINRAGGERVRDVDLFDIYEGGELPEGRKNLAFHIAYQAADKTLSSEEIEEIHSRITSELENKGWEVRE